MLRSKDQTGKCRPMKIGIDDFYQLCHAIAILANFRRVGKSHETPLCRDGIEKRYWTSGSSNQSGINQ
jgi:hypothetical protein